MTSTGPELLTSGPFVCEACPWSGLLYHAGPLPERPLCTRCGAPLLPELPEPDHVVRA